MRLMTRTLMGLMGLVGALSAQARGAAEPVARLNLHPTQAYVVRLHTDAAPGAFDEVVGDVLYQAGPPRCLEWKDRWAGVTVEARHRQPFAMHAVDATTYEGVVYLDQLVDEDYYGLGVCHWSVNVMTVELRKNGTLFTASVPGDPQGGEQATYIPIRDYNEAAAGHGPDAAATTTNPQVFGVPTFTLTVNAEQR